MFIEKEEWLKDEGYWKAELKPSLSVIFIHGKDMEITANTHGLESQLCCVLFARCWEIAWPLILDYNKWKHLLLYKLKKGVLHILLIRSHILYVLSPNRIFTLCKESLCLQIKKKSKTIIWFRTLKKWIKKSH